MDGKWLTYKSLLCYQLLVFRIPKTSCFFVSIQNSESDNSIQTNSIFSFFDYPIQNSIESRDNKKVNYSFKFLFMSVSESIDQSLTR